MKLTRLAAAPGRMRQGAAAWPRRRGSAATASQLIAGVGQTCSLGEALGLGVAAATRAAKARPILGAGWRLWALSWSRAGIATEAGPARQAVVRAVVEAWASAPARCVSLEAWLPNKAIKLTSALAERTDLLGVTCWRSAMGRQEAPRRSQLIASVRRTSAPEVRDVTGCAASQHARCAGG